VSLGCCALLRGSAEEQPCHQMASTGCGSLATGCCSNSQHWQNRVVTFAPSLASPVVGEPRVTAKNMAQRRDHVLPCGTQSQEENPRRVQNHLDSMVNHHPCRCPAAREHSTVDEEAMLPLRMRALETVSEAVVQCAGQQKHTTGQA